MPCWLSERDLTMPFLAHAAVLCLHSAVAMKAGRSILSSLPCQPLLTPATLRYSPAPLRPPCSFAHRHTDFARSAMLARGSRPNNNGCTSDSEPKSGRSVILLFFIFLFWHSLLCRWVSSLLVSSTPAWVLGQCGLQTLLL